MTVLKTRKSGGFTQIDNTTIRNAGLSLKAKGLLLVMMSCSADWNFNMVWLEKQSDDGKQAHQSALAELLAQGYVIRERQHGTDGHWIWAYHVADTVHGPTVDGSTMNGKSATRKREFKKKDPKKSEVYRSRDECGREEAHTAPEIAALRDDVAPEPVLSSVLEPQAADAATALDVLTVSDFAELFGPENINDQGLEKVAAAAGPVETVGLLMPVPALASRPQATQDSPEYTILKSLIGKNLDTYLSELTPTGKRSREDWKRLTVPELQQLREVTLRESKLTGALVPTLASRGLDRLIGAVPRPKQQDNVQTSGAAYLMAKRPIFDEPTVPEVGKFKPGATYRRKIDDQVLQLVGTEKVRN